MSARHYGIVDDIAEGEPGAATGNLAVSSVLTDSIHAPDSLIVIGSTTYSAINLAQLVLTAEQAIKLGALITSAAQEALAADRRVEMYVKHGAAAARLCFALSEASEHDVLVDQSKVRIGYPSEAQDLAERAYDAVTKAQQFALRGEWRVVWRRAGELIAKGGAL